MYLAGLLPVQNAVRGPKFEETTACSSGMPYTAEDQASQKMKATPNISNQQNLNKLHPAVTDSTIYLDSELRGE